MSSTHLEIASTRNPHAARFREYKLILHLQYEHSSQGDADADADTETLSEEFTFLDHPQIEYEHYLTVTITLDDARDAYINRLGVVESEKPIVAVSVVDGGGLQFARDEHGSRIEAGKWDECLDNAIYRTMEEVEESTSEVKVADGFSVDDGDDDHFGDREDHQAMVTGKPALKDEYEMV